MIGNEIAIDFGTANTLIYFEKEIVLNEPTVAAFDLETETPIVFGGAAYKMIGRTPDRIQTICPVHKGVISDFEVAEQMLRYFFRKICGYKMFKPSVVCSIPSGITAVEHRFFEDVLKCAGARKICFLESSIAAAIGIGIDFSRPHGSIIVDIGAGSTDVAVLSMGGMAECASIKTAGNDLDESIEKYVRRSRNIAIGLKTAESIKINIGSVAKTQLSVSMKAKGRNLYNGLPEIFEITSGEVFEAMEEPLGMILKGIQGVMERTPPELMGDILTDGIMLVGNGSKLKGLPSLMAQRLGVKAGYATDIEGCIVKGAGQVLKNIELLANTDYQVRQLRDLMID